jgi:catechol 2,3-dioxygenase-like lactoylglutathione lyase family enzyme
MTALAATPVTPAPLAPTRLVRLHVGLYVSDLARSSAFFRVLLNCEPTKDFPDYVHFESDEPAVILALSPGARRPGGTLNHIGLRLTSAEALVAVQKRLETAGYRTLRQEGVACCYAWQTKFWITDPDYNLWEIYVLQHDLNRHGFEDAPRVEPPPTASTSIVWEHKASELPRRTEAEDGSIDEARLLGSINGDLSEQQRRALLAEAWRVLRPGGRLVVTGLVSDRVVPGDPDLPGLASRMRRVPVETEPLSEVRDAGFVDLFCEELSDIHCFRIDGVELRKFRLHAVKPGEAVGAVRYEVLYRGPFRAVTDDQGRQYPRSQRVPVPFDVWVRLQQEPARAQFQFFAPESA